MEEIVLTSSWRDRFEDIAGDRKKVIAWAAAVFIPLLVALLFVRASARQPVVAVPATQEAVPSPMSTADAGGALFVHVAGAVKSPGLYRFATGLRVADAVKAAGGPTRRGDLDALNLAEVLSDGLKIEVPTRSQAANVVAPASPSPAVIDLNTADAMLLETVPGVGPVTAAAIIQHRTEIGAFESVDQLIDVSGIGPATLESLRPYVTV